MEIKGLTHRLLQRLLGFVYLDLWELVFIQYALILWFLLHPEGNVVLLRFF
jgi:hypothetical protein